MVDYIKNNKVSILLISGILIACLAPIILIRPALIKIFDFSQSGQIGDTIGGIAGPILNLVGLLLVYFSFQEQLTANNNQSTMIIDEKKRNEQDKNFYLILNLFNHFKEQSSQIPISKIVHEYVNIEDDNVLIEGKYYGTLEVKYLLELAEFVINKSETLNLSTQDKEYINTIFVHYFFSNYEVLLKGIEKNKQPCVNCGKIHYSPKVLEENLNRIKDKITNLESSEYLNLIIGRNTEHNN